MEIDELHHFERHQPLGVTRDAGKRSRGEQARAVLDQTMADEAELGFHGRSVVVEPSVGVGGCFDVFRSC